MIQLQPITTNPVTYAGLRVKLSGNHNRLLPGKPRAYNTETKHTLFRCKTSKRVTEVQSEKRKRSSLSPFINLRTGSTLLPRPFTSWGPGTGDSISGYLGYCIQSVPAHFHNQFIRVVHQVNYSTKQGRNELGIVCLSLLTERVHERDCSLGCKNNLSHENTQRIWVKLHLKDAFCLSQNNKKFYPSHAGDRILRGCHEFIHNGPDSSVIFNRQH